MNNDAQLIYNMFRQSPFPGASSIGAISGRLDEMKKDKRWREEYDLKKKQIESAIGYRDLMKKLQEEKSDRDKKDIRKLEEYKKKNLQMGQTPVTAQTGLSPYGALAQGFGGAVSGLPGMGALGKGIEAFGKRIPETITAKPTPATIEERRRDLYKETFPEKVYGKELKEPTKPTITEGKDFKWEQFYNRNTKKWEYRKTKIPVKGTVKAPKYSYHDGYILNESTGDYEKVKGVVTDKPSYQIVDVTDKRGNVVKYRVNKITNKAVKIEGLPTGYKAPTGAKKPVDYKKLFHQYEMKRLGGGTVMEFPSSVGPGGEILPGLKMSTGAGKLPEITLQDFKVWYDTGKLPKKSPVGGGKEKDWKKYLK